MVTEKPETSKSAYTVPSEREYKKEFKRNLTKTHVEKAKEYIKNLISTLDTQTDELILKENKGKVLGIKEEFPVAYATVIYDLNQPLYKSLETFKQNYLKLIENSISEDYEENEVQFVTIYKNEIKNLKFFTNINSTINFLTDYIESNEKNKSRIRKILDFFNKHKLIIQNNRLNTDKNKQIKEQYDLYMTEITSFEFIYLYFKSKYNTNAVDIFNKFDMNISILNKYMQNINILLEENEIAKDLEDINYLRINAELTKTLQNIVSELNNVIELHNMEESVSKFDESDFNALADILEIQNNINKETLVDNKVIEKTKILLDK